MKVLLEDLPKANLEGKRINVTRQGGQFHYNYQDVPMIRHFLEAIYKVEKGIKWVYWYWIAKNDSLQFDCGYSGQALTEKDNKSYLEV